MSDDAPRCTAHSSQTGDRCRNRPMKGATVCSTHGGRAPQVQGAAERRLERQAAEHAVATYGLPREIEPAQALLEEVHRSAGHVAWLGALVADLDPGELKQLDTSERFEKPSVWVELYQHERTHLARVAKAALDAGIAERQVRLAESQGALLADTIRAILDDLGLSPEQAGRVPEIVPRHLRALTGGAA